MATSYITDFIQSLSSEEVKIVREYVYKSNTRPILGENKIEKLFHTLVNNPEKKFTYGELSGILESNDGALRVLKSRLFDKVKDALLSDNHFENDLVFNFREQIVFSLKKKILLAKSLYRKVNQGKLETINKMLLEIIKTSQKYEVYDVLIEALTLHKYKSGMRLGVLEFERVNSEIVFYERCLKSLQNANDAYFRFIINKDFIATLTNKKLGQYVHASIKQMEADYKITKSKEVNYYLHIFKIILAEQNKNFKLAIAHCKSLLVILKKNHIIYSKDRIGYATSNLGHFNIFIGNYKEALIYLKKALNIYIPNSISSITTKEQEFYAYFYAKNLSDAHTCLKEIYQCSLSDTGLYRKSKFIYYEAYVLFVTKKFKESLQLLNKSLEFEKDKTIWKISLRILMTMIFIELNKAGEASRSIDTLRKHVERTSKMKEIKVRDIIILKLLRELEKDGFKRNEKNKTALKLLAELSNKNKPTSWNYFTPELIPFHEWVLSLPTKSESILRKQNKITA
jgi:tetratricopeptide (TPR) repeat protein